MNLHIIQTAIAVTLLAGCAASHPTAGATVHIATYGGTPAASARADPHCLYGCPKGAAASDVVLKRTFYALSNNRSTKFADWVAYEVKTAWIGGPDRDRKWTADPDLAPADTLEPNDYDGFSAPLDMERGHQAPLESFTNAPNWEEANYLSNITPQNANLNGGKWAQLEKAERQLAQSTGQTVYVVTGPLYEKSMPKLPNADEPHRIPSGYWKVVALKSGAATGFIFQNAHQPGTYCNRIVSISQLERHAHLNIFPDVKLNNLMSLKTQLKC